MEKEPFTTRELAEEMLLWFDRDVPQTVVKTLRVILQNYVMTGVYDDKIEEITGQKPDRPLLSQRLKEYSLPLFQMGDFTLHSGQKAKWKIQCHTLNDNDWETLALMASEKLAPFGAVVGVPTGGLKFAAALEKYITPNCQVTLIADDVLTTGISMQQDRHKYFASIGITVFARGTCPSWVKAIFQM